MQNKDTKIFDHEVVTSESNITTDTLVYKFENDTIAQTVYIRNTEEKEIFFLYRLDNKITHKLYEISGIAHKNTNDFGGAEMEDFNDGNSTVFVNEYLYKYNTNDSCLAIRIDMETATKLILYSCDSALESKGTLVKQ